MNKVSKIEPDKQDAEGGIYTVLAKRMIADGVHQVRYYVGGYFSVEMRDGRKGVGQGVEAAIANAAAKVAA